MRHFGKFINTMIRPKLEYAEVIWYPHEKKHVLKLERKRRIATKMVPELEDLTYEERLKEMHLTLKERRERGDLITIYTLMNNLEETDRKDLILRRKGEHKNLRGHKKILHKGICLKDTKKVQFSPKKYKYLEWNKGRGDNGKKCTSTEGKTRQIYIRRQDHTSVAQALYTTTM